MDAEKNQATVTGALPVKVLGELSSASGSEHVPDEALDHAISRRVTRKTDFRLVPMLMMLYLTAYLDRTNIGNAKLLGLEKELNMPANGYNTALWVFYLSFVLLEVPSNLLLTWSKLKPNVWLGTAMTILGIVTMCQGFAKSAGALYACRFIMGIFEGALTPAAALLMGQYYRRHEFGIRYACFTTSALIGASFSSFLAYAINFMGGTAGISSWRWIFILEGLFNICVAVTAFWILPGFPAEAKFLTDEERSYLLRRLEVERGKEKMGIKHLTKMQWVRLIFDWKVWVNVVGYFGADMSASAISAFSPTILSQLGWTANEANLRNVPIWLVGACISLATNFTAGKTGKRYPFILIGVAMCTTGWSIQLAQVNPPGVRYFALYLIASGGFLQMALFVNWLNNNMLHGASKAVGHAVQIGLGNSANFVSSNVFLSWEAPRYPSGFTAGLVVTLVGGVGVIANVLLLKYANKKADEREARGEGGQLQDADGVRFRYIL